MITMKHLQIYKKYHGDIDAYARRSKREADIMNDEMFYALSRILSELAIINNGLADDSFKNQTLVYLNSLCENEEVVLAIKNMKF